MTTPLETFRRGMSPSNSINCFMEGVPWGRPRDSLRNPRNIAWAFTVTHDCPWYPWVFKKYFMASWKSTACGETFRERFWHEITRVTVVHGESWHVTSALWHVGTCYEHSMKLSSITRWCAYPSPVVLGPVTSNKNPQMIVGGVYRVPPATLLLLETTHFCRSRPINGLADSGPVVIECPGFEPPGRNNIGTRIHGERM